MFETIGLLLIGAVFIAIIRKLYPPHRGSQFAITGVSALMAGAVLLALTTIGQEDLVRFQPLPQMITVAGLVLVFLATPICFLIALIKFQWRPPTP